MSWCVSRCPEAFTDVSPWQRVRSPLRNTEIALLARGYGVDAEFMPFLVAADY
jgi:hypothetical protein